jgi:hypothetical protein
MLLVWKSAAISNRLIIANFNPTLTMGGCKSDTQASKGWKESAEMWKKTNTYDPLAMYYGNRKGAGKGEGNPKLVPHISV